MQTDPIGYEADLNLYTYANNDPLNYTDPNGENPAAAGAVALCTGPQAVGCAIAGAAIVACLLWCDDLADFITAKMAEHTSGARPSTQPKHEKGKNRKKKDSGGEKGDKQRRRPRKRPDKWKGPWPPPEGAAVAAVAETSATPEPPTVPDTTGEMELPGDPDATPTVLPEEEKIRNF